jgi:hypothetical protein
MNKEKLKQIVLDLLEIRRGTDLSSTDDTLLSCAERIYVSELINENNQAMKEAPKRDWRSEPISPAQEEFFLKRKIPIKAGWTKGDVSPLIDEIKKKEMKKNGQV